MLLCSKPNCHAIVVALLLAMVSHLYIFICSDPTCILTRSCADIRYLITVYVLSSILLLFEIK